MDASDIIRKWGRLLPPADPPAAENGARGGEDATGSLDGVEIAQTSVVLAKPPEKPTAAVVYDHFVESLSETTRRAYGEDLDSFAAWLGLGAAKEAIVHLLGQDAANAHLTVARWDNGMRDDGYSPATRARRLSAVRAAVKLGNQLGVVDWKIHVKAPKVSKVRDTRGVDPEDARKMLAACGDDLEGLRNRLLVTLLFVMGLRRIEVVRLLVAHYDAVKKRLLVHGKGWERDAGKVVWRDVPLDDAELVERWVCEAHGSDPPPQSALFFGWKNNHRTKGITPRGVHYVVSQLGESVGVRVWPHSLRHAAVTTGLKKGHPLHEVQSFARHVNPATTQVYNDDVENAPGRVAETLSRVLKG